KIQAVDRREHFAALHHLPFRDFELDNTAGQWRADTGHAGLIGLYSTGQLDSPSHIGHWRRAQLDLLPQIGVYIDLKRIAARHVDGLGRLLSLRDGLATTASQQDHRQDGSHARRVHDYFLPKSTA